MESWVIPCNPKYYDIFGAFRELKTIDWRQTVKSIKAGDIVYIYVGRPVQAITHKCIVLKTNIQAEKADYSDGRFESDDQDGLQPYWRFMRLKLLKEYSLNLLTYSEFVEQGLKGSIQGQMRVCPSIQVVIERKDRDSN